MVFIGPTESKINLSLNQFNEQLNIGTLKAFDKDNYHYVFRLKNSLTEYEQVFTPELTGLYQSAGDLWYNTQMNTRQNEFLFKVSTTSSNIGIYITGSNYDPGSQWNLEVFVNSGSMSVGTPSVGSQSILLTEYRAIFTG